MKKLGFQKVRSGLQLIAINLLVLFGFLELGSLGFYWIKNQQLFYTRQKIEDYQALGINLEGVRFGETVVERLHPFFGFVQKPGPDFRPGFKYNNYGFIAPEDYPFKKTNPNQFLIGVLGGSVASNYAIYEVRNKVLEKTIRQVPGLQNKEVVILPLAIGGYKQPQQLLVLNYMLSVGQEFDLVINLDGFNEVALVTLNHKRGLDLTMPSASHVQPLTSLANNSLSTKALKTLLNIKENKAQLNQSLKILKDCKLASCHLINSLKVQGLTRQYRQNLQKFEQQRLSNDDDQESIIFFYTQDPDIPDPEFYQQAADYWMKTSLLMQQTLSQNQIPYLHVLQPNQYWKTARKFGSEEKKIAFTENSPYAKGVEIGYPLLLKNVDQLTKSQVNILNATNIFDPIQEPVYIDNCCHYNPRGEKILSEFVAREVVNQLRSKNSNNKSPRLPN
ncbi:MAG: hypothetical protein HC835_06975 [Oscillatoriales cyanobacterium RM2_1_1]|nr:hypothetical protein [Oscillatoriales cyanobacterium SM2_3_0]NJO45385.1 hypothetical protein [Oscillatoriales cyanobacterium RM2_1_1]